MLSFDQTYNLSQKLKKKNIQTKNLASFKFTIIFKKFETCKIDNANRFYSNSLCVPSDDKLSISDIDKISNYIKKYYSIIRSNINL